MIVFVEFYGVPRARAGVSKVMLEFATENTSLGTVLIALQDKFPQLAEECIHAAGLQAGYMANLDGDVFIRNAEVNISDGQSLLIMSADAGG